MEDRQIKCPVCDSNITGNYCKTCGFPVRRVLAPLPDALQEEEQQRIDDAKERWNIFLKKDEEIESLNKLKDKLSNDVEEANKKTEEANKTISERNGQIAKLNADIESLKSKEKELVEEKKKIEDEKIQIEKKRDEKIGDLNALINQLKKELESKKNSPSPTTVSTQMATNLYLVQQDEDGTIDNVYPILTGKTVFGKSPIKKGDAYTCRIVCSEEQQLENEHFIIEVEPKNPKTPYKAVLINGKWCIDRLGKSPKETDLSNGKIILIGNLHLIFIEKSK